MIITYNICCVIEAKILFVRPIWERDYDFVSIYLCCKYMYCPAVLLVQFYLFTQRLKQLRRKIKMSNKGGLYTGLVSSTEWWFFLC